MNKKALQIHIIGAGVSGLIAAQVLENHGYYPTILEKSSNVGGRVKTDNIKDYQLDHGFQVLLEAYPKAKQYLDFQSLELQSFLPGAVVFKKGALQIIGDPLRNISFLLPTLTSSVGNFMDKIRIFKLNLQIKGKSLDDIFKEPETTTLQYLKKVGFSNTIIEQFFKPFFSGIFLEPDLQTSSRMFEFVYKMFGEGLAVIPKAGIGAIPKQLLDKLTRTEVIYDTSVKEVMNGNILLEDGTQLSSDFTIIATEATNLVQNLKRQDIEWRSCDNLYFEVTEKAISKKLIGLISDKDALINNILFCNNLATNSKGKKELLSVTVVKQHQLSKAELLEKVTKDLATYCNIKDVKLLKHYHIKKALPKLSNLQHDIEPSEIKLTDTIFLAGDQLLNGSLNAAMSSGEKAALALIYTLEAN